MAVSVSKKFAKKVGEAQRISCLPESAGTIHADRRKQNLCGHYYAISRRGDIFNRSKNGLRNPKKLMISDSPDAR
jgi:hypothetical protein